MFEAKRNIMARFFTVMACAAVGILTSVAQVGGVDKQSAQGDKSKEIVQSGYAWSITEPLGERYPSTIDTLQYNYQRQAVPSLVSDAYATTGNLGGEGINMIFFDREEHSDFFFADALRAWMPSLKTHKFYNTRIPMTLLSYNTGGGKQNVQDRLRGIFSGNINKKAEVGAYMDYLYSKGSYNYQATSDFNWGAFGSYLGDRYEVQAYYNHMSLLNKENGGIVDDRYITNTAEMTGGDDHIDFKSIPTNLTAAHSHVKGQELFVNNRYKIGYYHHTYDSVYTDSIVNSEYIPVTSFIWTLNYKSFKHKFINTNAREDTAFFKHTYLNLGGTDDNTSMWSLKNTFGVQLLEGFNKYAKFGLAAYLTHEIRRYNQTTDSALWSANRSPLLTPFPDVTVPQRATENLVWVGGQLTKQRGSLLTYSVLGQVGLIGPVVGDLDIGGDVSTKFKLFGDSVKITGYGYFKNQEVPYLLKNYVSNHFVWRNDFGKTRRLRFGGRINIPHTGTSADVGFETLQNYVFFNSDGLPTQQGDNVQVFSARINQRLSYRALHWDNQITYQKSSNQNAIPLPQLAIYSNLYLQFLMVKVLNVQVGVDCDYYTAYNGYAYNPATMSFHSQNEVKVGNYPFINAYLTCKLKKARFYVMMSHLNQGWFSHNYFSVAHYPLNPQRFQLGVSVDFAN